ncbi:MAG: hypothetical protein A3K10_01705 [Bacteroidetes bacterium RIFCSPLOWO2_12_FULL_31_6]|nr:MAG: hypothetical protein A3K10_01705 [Bacteroidetes bacterium RIFCSPLOWO2_12_FULL_31_6]
MTENKLFSLIKTLSGEEFHWFERYVKSGFFNKRKDLIQLVEAIKKFHPAYDSRNLTEEKLFKSIYPKEKYDNKKLRYILSDTSKLLEEFLIYTELEKESTYKTTLLLRSFNKRNLDKYFLSKQNSEEENIKTIEQKDAEYYFHQHLINATIHSFNSKIKNRGIDESLQIMSDNLDWYYLSTKLKYCCEILNRQNVISVEYDISMLSEVLQHLEKRSYEHIPAISIYYQILLTLRDGENETHFLKLKETLDKNHNIFNKTELRDMYAFAQNYCIKRINLGKSIFLKELFHIYQVLLVSEIIFTDGVLSQWDYKNIVVVGLRLDQEEWIGNFIEAYKNKLNADERENAYLFNSAYFSFYKKQYSTVLKKLQQVEFSDLYYQLDSKNLLVKTFYEKDDQDALFACIASFTTFIKKNKLVSEYQRLAYLNFLKLVEDLSTLDLSKKENRSNLETSITTTIPLADITWLLKKINETH